MWDRDVLSANDIIAETSIDLYRWFLKVCVRRVSLIDAVVADFCLLVPVFSTSGLANGSTAEPTSSKERKSLLPP